ncbi:MULTISPECIES: hypothetical protein [Fusobacterium]|nr:hypothetical protein [Fusobacterium sp. CM22]EUB15728.1 hypothetical protein HMPREF1500_0944 [Fusobacterium sp. CM22]BEO96047.1 hypothetical protein FNCP10_09020 [Fusobacterium nucleatum]BEP08154.1 hypothetical protein FNSP10_15280 [Fusobacterium nucleatum]
MSKYRVGFLLSNSHSTNAKVIDLVDDWDYTEKEAKEIVNSDDKLNELLGEWLSEVMWSEIKFLKTKKEQKEWVNLNG